MQLSGVFSGWTVVSSIIAQFTETGEAETLLGDTPGLESYDTVLNLQRRRHVTHRMVGIYPRKFEVPGARKKDLTDEQLMKVRNDLSEFSHCANKREDLSGAEASFPLR